MSTKNDKTNNDLINLSNQLIVDFGNIELLKDYWFSHSRRQIDKEFQEKYNCSYYYAKKIFNSIFGFRDRLPEEFVVIQHQNMDKTNLEKYGRTNLGQFGTEEHTKAIKEKYGVDNPAQAEPVKEKTKCTCIEKYGYERAMLDPNIKEKVKLTCLNKYNVEFPLQSEAIRAKCKNTIEQIYGVDNPAKAKIIQEKIKQTNLERYGAEQFVLSDKYLVTARKKYHYDNISFDSSWELALYIYAKDHDEEIERTPIKLEYYVNNKLHYYFPDFKYNGQLIEIKGKQFLTIDNRLKPCYTNDNEELSQAKYQCILDNNIEIWPYEKVKFALDYVKQIYGKDYLKQFKKRKQNNGKDNDRRETKN